MIVHMMVSLHASEKKSVVSYVCYINHEPMWLKYWDWLGITRRTWTFRTTWENLYFRKFSNKYFVLHHCYASTTTVQLPSQWKNKWFYCNLWRELCVTDQRTDGQTHPLIDARTYLKIWEPNSMKNWCLELLTWPIRLYWQS